MENVSEPTGGIKETIKAEGRTKQDSGRPEPLES